MLGVAILLVVAGIASIWRADYLASRVSFGWFAYAPLSDTTFTPSNAPQVGLEWGLGLLGAGLVVLAVLLGRAWRRRHPAARAGVDVALGVAALAAVVVGVGLHHWAVSHVFLGWGQVIPRRSAGYVVLTEQQFSLLQNQLFGPRGVGFALVMLGLVLAAVAVGRRSPVALRRPSVENRGDSAPTAPGCQ
ncbi:hypothetical protein AX769_09600 [Frondihabitans sp. PAMC 28766]|nr:hypothetical protein AX769_09600 [Frondihabitans sp. PAMC 28766]